MAKKAKGTSRTNNNRDELSLCGLANLRKRGSVINPSADDFLNLLETENSNLPQIAGIIQNLSGISNPSEDEISALQKIFSKYIPEVSAVSEKNDEIQENTNERTEIFLSSKCSIMDCTDIDEIYMDEYHMILESEIPVHKFILKTKHMMNNFQVKYTNEIFGNFRISTTDTNVSVLLKAFERENIIKSIFENFGYVDIYGNKPCSKNLKLKIFDELASTHPQSRLKRTDFSKFAILQIGELEITSSNNETEKIYQYLITDLDVPNETQNTYLVYGYIDMDLLNSSVNYYNEVADIFLSRENLKKSCYVGILAEPGIISKTNYGFGEPISITKKLF